MGGHLLAGWLPLAAAYALPCWVLAAVEKAALHAAITAWAPGQLRTCRHTVRLLSFTHRFPSVERALGEATQDSRLWGWRLLEVWTRRRMLAGPTAAANAGLHLPPGSV